MRPANFVILILLLSLIPYATGQQSNDLNISLDSTITVSEFGLVIVNETFTVTNPTSLPISLPTLSVTLPPEYFSKIVASDIAAPIDMTPTISNSSDETRITLTSSQPFSVPPGNASTLISVEFALSEIIEMYQPGLYKFKASMIPTSDLFLNEVKSTFFVPASITYSNETEGFERGGAGLLESLSSMQENVTSADQRDEFVYLVERPGGGEFSLIKFEDASRIVTISASGEVSVREELKMRNVGSGTFTSITLSSINEELIRVTVLPPKEPPLLNPFRLTLISSKIDLQRGFSSTLPPNEYVEIIYEYELDSKFIKIGLGTIAISLPVSSPVNALMDNYKIGLDIPSSFKIIDEPESLLVDKQNQLYGDEVTFKVRPGIASATHDAFPIGTALFIIALVGLLFNQREDGKEGKEIVTQVEELGDIYEDKISIITSIVTNFTKMELEKIQRKQIENIRSEVNVMRARSLPKVTELKRALLKLNPNLEKMIEELTSIDQSLDRAIWQFIQTYDQHLVRRIKREAFRSKIDDLDKQIKKKSNDIAVLLQRLVRESERG